MKKLILALCLLLMVSVGAAGEEMQTETAPTVAEIALTMRPESEEPTHLTVGNSTKVSGSFFTTQFGTNTSDIDVRYMLHGYNPIVWMNQLEFTTDPMVVDSLESADTRAGRTYTIRIADGLTYNDGVTPVTAEDYVFSYLLLDGMSLLFFKAALSLGKKRRLRPSAQTRALMRTLWAMRRLARERRTCFPACGSSTSGRSA